MPYLILVVALALLSSPLEAQIGNPGFMMPDTRFDEEGLPLPHQPNADDRLFALLAASGNRAEIRFGEFATGKAEAAAVKDFSQRMVEDHSAAAEKLAAIAKDSGIALPEELTEEHQAMLEELEALEGRDFDLAYMRGQVIEHQKTTQLLIWEIASGQDAPLQRFAVDALPTVIQHLEHARAILGELIGKQLAAAPPASNNEEE